MSDKAADHCGAAGRHEVAAHNHERAAGFWDDHCDSGRAALQREMAEHERRGAELERRWAELMELDATGSASRPPDVVVRHTRLGAKQVSGLLARMAKTLERSAGLAEEHAERCERAGRGEDAAAEHRAAERARQTAERARAQAEKWLKLADDRKP